MLSQPYLLQSATWPTSGRHILAAFDQDSIVVYQAYRAAIAEHAVSHQKFGGEFSFSRMSWIKPNFLWMMYRSGWATKEGQERILAIRLRRGFFDSLLTQAVASSYDPARHVTREQWEKAVARSDVRLQWDPDHDPLGGPLQRKALQLGLRGASLRSFGEQELVSVEDITAFVLEQRGHLDALQILHVPVEQVYRPAPEAEIAVGLDRVP